MQPIVITFPKRAAAVSDEPNLGGAMTARPVTSKRLFRGGAMIKAVLSILPQAAEPLTSRDIALELLVTRAFDKDDQTLLALMTKRVGVTLRLQRLNGIVRSASGPRQFMLWRIAH